MVIETSANEVPADCRVPSGTSVLPKEFQAELANARISRVSNYAEVAAAEVSMWVIELSVIEDIEELSAEFKRGRFGDVRTLEQRQVGIEDSWPGEETPVSGTEVAELLRSKRVGQEVGIRTVGSRLSRVLSHDLAYQIRRICRALSDQRLIAGALTEGDREP